MTDALREDAVEAPLGTAPRFAVARSLQIDPVSSDLWEEVPGSGVIWRTRIVSPGATSLNLGFDRFRLPSGASLFVYSAERQRVLRPFTPQDNKPHGQLWTPPIPGDDLVVELHLATREDSFDLRIATVNVGYRGFGAAGAIAGSDQSGACHVDVACPEAAPWRDQADAVGMITINGTRYCSGAMINNTALDRRPLFLTAAHCGVTLQNAPTVVVLWQYEHSACRPPGAPGSGGPGDGSLDRFQSGAILRAASPSSDFSLLELDDDPAALWSVAFAGWDRGFTSPLATATIHHPETNEKRISFDFDPPSVTSYLAFPTPGNGSHWRVADWDAGTTEPGSSGGPLFNQEHRIVGQLHGGYAACDNDDSDWFGRLAVAWEGGGSSDTRLRDWLDPIGSGVVTLDHLPGRGLGVTPTRGVIHVGAVGGPFTQPEVAYTISNSTAQPLDFRVTPPPGGVIAVQSATTPLEGKLSPGAVAVVLVSLTPLAAELVGGVHDFEVLFEDLSNQQGQSRRHVLEVGQTSFAVAPVESVDWSVPHGGPLRESSVFFITSARPTPVSVLVTPSAPWILINGAPGPTTVPIMNMDAPVAVVLSPAPSAANLPDGVYDAAISFQSLNAGTGDTTRPLRLEVGRAAYRATDVPLPIQDLGNLVSRITVPDDWCIGDLEVAVDVSHTYVGDLVVRLQSPSGTAVTLHNRSGGSSNDLRVTYDDDGLPPDGAGALGDYLLETSAGTWTLFVADNNSEDVGALRGWTLLIRPIRGVCPSRQPAIAFSLETNPGWTTQGAWAFGRPTGGGTLSRDPTTGHTGLNVYGYNLNGDYANHMVAPQHLTTRALDCSGLVFTQLRFRRWLGVESAQYDHAGIEASRDGATWRTVWRHNTSSSIRDASWSLQTHDLSRVADGARTLYLRWGLGPTDGSNTFAGWNIDDVEVWGVPAYADCNRNGVADLIDLNTGTSADCDGDGAPDECGLADGSSEDCDDDGVPDECQCLSLPGALAEPAGALKNRYLSLVPPRSACPSAMRVNIRRLPGGFAGREGLEYWVGPPTWHADPTSQPPWFHAAPLQCAPHVRVWDDVDVLHVFGAAVVPGAEYEVRVAHEGCFSDGPLPEDFSAPLTLETATWGDVLNPTDGGQPSFTDITAVVQKFRSESGSLRKTQCQLHPDAPSPGSTVNFLDIAHVIDAFRGGDYPFPGPVECP